MINQEYIIDALQFLDDEILLEAAENPDMNKKSLSETRSTGSARQKTAFSLKRLAAVSGLCAACLVGIILYRSNILTDTQNPGKITGDSSSHTAGKPSASSESAHESSAEASTETTHDTENYDGLPVLSLPEIQLPEGMGSNVNSAYVLANDVSELINSNPWYESSNIEELPVYINSRPSYPWPPAVSESQLEEMNAFLIEIAGRLGIPENELIFSDRTQSEEVLQKTEGAAAIAEISASWQDITLTVNYDMTAEILFSDPVQLPSEYSISDQTSYYEMENAALYLKEEYKKLLSMDDPQANIYGGDYMYDGQKSPYKLSFYDGSGSYEDQLIHYNFYQTEFYFDDSSKIYLIRINNTDLSNTPGDYPAITFDEAEQLLAKKLSESEEESEAESPSIIAGGELVYLFQGHDEYFVPYYKFYVEQPSATEENGLKHFSICYIPAIESRFIEYYTEDGSVSQ